MTTQTLATAEIEKWLRVQVLFSQIFDSGSERKMQNPSGVDSGTPNSVPPVLAAQKGRLACCTTGRASGLHIRLGCGKGRARGLPFSAARPFVQYAGPPFCFLCSPPKIHVFHLETRPSSPLGTPINAIQCLCVTGSLPLL